MIEKKFLIIFIFLLLCFGCKKHENSATEGTMTLLVSEPYGQLMSQEATQFTSIYQQTHIQVVATSTRDAIVQLLNDSVHTICIDRKLNDEEMQVAARSSIHVIENMIATDGFAVIVNEINPLTKIYLQSIENIIVGEKVLWQQIEESHWSGSIDFVSMDRNSGQYELLQQQIFHQKKELHTTAITANQSGIIEYVSNHPQAIGFISLLLVPTLQKTVKVVAVEATDENGGKIFLQPTQQNIYQKLYRLKYSLYLYNTEAKAALGNGFGAFILALQGQKIIQNAGIVPAIVPSRPIQLTAE